MPRLALALLAAVAVFVAARLGLAWFVDAYACGTPRPWWPDWAWRCRDGAAPGVVRTLTRADWDAALPAMLAAATLLAIGLTGRR